MSLPSATERQKLALEQRKNDLRFIANTPQGQRFFTSFIHSTCAPMRVVLGGPDVDAQKAVLATYRNDGRAEVGAELDREIREASIEAWSQMNLERVRDAASEAKVRASEAVPRSGEASSR